MELHTRIDVFRQERVARLLRVQLPIVTIGIACVLAGIATVSIAPDAWQAGYVPLHIGPFLLLLAVVPSIAVALRVFAVLLALCLTYVSVALLLQATAGLFGCTRVTGGTPSGAQCARAGVTLAIGIVIALLALNVGSLYIVLAFRVGRARAVLRAVWRAMGVAQLALCVWYCGQLGALLAGTVGPPPAEVALFAALALVSLGLGGLSLWEPLPRVVHAFLAHRGSRVGAAAGVAELFHGRSAGEVITHARLTFRAIRLDKLRREHFAQPPTSPPARRSRSTVSNATREPSRATHASVYDADDVGSSHSATPRRSERVVPFCTTPVAEPRLVRRGCTTPVAEPRLVRRGFTDSAPAEQSVHMDACARAEGSIARTAELASARAGVGHANAGDVASGSRGSPISPPQPAHVMPLSSFSRRQSAYRIRLASLVIFPTAGSVDGEQADTAQLADDATQRRALFLLSEPVALGAVDAFISHSWRDDADAKWAALQSWRDAFVIAHKREPLCWYDKACIDPDHLQDQLGSLPVYLAGCKTLLALVGPTYWSRLWCVIEMFVHFEMGASIERVQMVQFGFADGERLSESEIDVTKASATDPADEERLRAVIEGSGEGPDGLNEWLRELVRSCRERDALRSGGDSKSENDSIRKPRARSLISMLSPSRGTPEGSLHRWRTATESGKPRSPKSEPHLGPEAVGEERS
ncbi:hypothetical protein KFE25_001209 [Diacronema lutheri]|uniref:TIR domain-containing protein n=1 Tax=Diacronema lutheri TaxID=2081491 RepID=A0A8J5XM96_DIALT|nr:hypothetical protein KFE25_001209 [Diacronema lutheri]